MIRKYLKQDKNNIWRLIGFYILATLIIIILTIKL
mgnify:FL=1